MKIPVLLLLCSLGAVAEVKTITLRQAIDLALAQSPDLMIVRLDQQKARDQVSIAHDAFVPKVYGGSGAAWTSGFPSSIEGNAPSIFQAKTQMALYDRPQSYQVAQANEMVRGAGIDIARKQDDVVYQVACLFLDAEQAARSLDVARREVESLSRVRELVEARVAEGRELAIESKKADLAAKRARLNVEVLNTNLVNAETSLAQVLGLGPEDRVRAAQEDRTNLAVPASEEQSIEAAIEYSRDLKRIESNMQSKMLEIKGYKATRLPKVNLVAQYSLFAKYNYQDYFTRFQRNNGQLGASFEIPLLVGNAARAYISQGEADMAKYRIELDRTRARIAGDLRRAYQEVKRSESAREVSRLELDVARDQVAINLAQMDEGRLPLAAVEQARAIENDRWLVYYDAQHAADRARLSVLRLTGGLLVALR